MTISFRGGVDGYIMVTKKEIIKTMTEWLNSGWEVSDIIAPVKYVGHEGGYAVSEPTDTIIIIMVRHTGELKGG